MEIFAVSGLVNALTAVSFGVLVFIKNWRARQNQIFLLMTCALAIWGFSYWRWLSSDDTDTALFWVRLLGVGSVFIPVFFLDWVTILLQRGKKLRDFVALAYLGSVAVSAFALSDYFIAGISPKLWFPFWPNAGVLYAVYFWLLYTGVVLWSVHALYHGWRNEKDPLRRGQIFYVFWGAVLGFGGGFFNFFLWFDISIPPYGNFLVAVFPFLLGYSVLKHKLFNMRTIAAELTAFVLFVFMVIITFIAEGAVLKVVYGFFTVLMSIGGVMLIRAVYKTEKLSEDKSKFVSFASHEIRTPLTFIKGASANILEGDLGTVSDGLKDNLQKIFVRANDVLGLVEQYLDKSKLELGQLKYDMADFDLGTLVSQTVHNYQPSAEQEGVTLTSTAEENEDFNINGDQARIKEVLNNLVGNAIKFSPKGKVEIALSKTDNAVLIKITDSGIGIPAETMPLLFREFSRADNADKAKIAGTGLGLFLSKTFVDAHHGKIWAESEGAGKGSTFFVELPDIS